MEHIISERCKKPKRKPHPFDIKIAHYKKINRRLDKVNYVLTEIVKILTVFTIIHFIYRLTTGGIL
jgi:hypothetical protein